jgi:hypothetical protein
MMDALDAHQLGSQQPDSQLRRRRDQLADEVAELHWNLGGLAYEMAIRDHFRLDVLIRRAAMLQERDAELAQVERMLHMQESGSAGNCANCGAVRSRGAVFCWQCGAQVMERSTDNGNGRDVASHPIDLLAGATESGSDLATERSNDGGTWPAPNGEAVQSTQDLGRPVQTNS